MKKLSDHTHLLVGLIVRLQEYMGQWWGRRQKTLVRNEWLERSVRKWTLVRNRLEKLKKPLSHFDLKA